MVQSNTSDGTGIPPRGLFVTGSNTDVGKTHVSISILQSLVAETHPSSESKRIAAYKPIASGLSSMDDPNGDVFKLWNASSKHRPLEWSCSQVYRAALAPPFAARMEGREVDENRVNRGLQRWAGECDFILMEGAGGLLSPWSWNQTNAELARWCSYPLVIVVDNRLGAVNQALLTLEAAIQRGLPVRAIVLNDAGWEEHRELLAGFLQRLFSGLKENALPQILRHGFGEYGFFEACDWFSWGEP